MRARKKYDLDINFYDKDIHKLEKGETLLSITDEGLEMRVNVGQTERKRRFDVRKHATIQEVLPFSDYELFMLKLGTTEWIHGYNVTLRKDLFDKWISEARKSPLNENEHNPFWGRGVQFGLPIDRIHILYNPTLL